MKLPRDMDAPELITALQRIGYRVVRQSGLGQISHALYDVGGEYRRNM